MCSQRRIRNISLSVCLVFHLTEAHVKLSNVIWHQTRHNWLSNEAAGIGWTVSPTQITWPKTFPFSALRKLYEVLAARKTNLITARARKNKRTTARMLAKTIPYPFCSCNSVCSPRVHGSLPGLHGVNLKELQVTWNHYEGARIHTYISINPFSENTMRDELFTTFETYTVSPVFKLQQTKYDACWAATISMVNIRTHKVTLIITPSVKKI